MQRGGQMIEGNPVKTIAKKSAKTAERLDWKMAFPVSKTEEMSRRIVEVRENARPGVSRDGPDRASSVLLDVLLGTMRWVLGLYASST
mmetsp:Transcript_44206/g.117102  ORF Transcript_44206/g.117102 Transcript_44206/m.117102 type:complete len:88 (-) Transcript_44206:175-438(-)